MSLCVKDPFADSFTSTKMVFHHTLELGHQFTVHFINDFLYFDPFFLLMAMPKLDFFTLSHLISPQTWSGKHN